MGEEPQRPVRAADDERRLAATVKDRDRCRVAALLPRVQPFILSGYSGQPTRGTVTIHEFRREQRARRAFAVLGKWWGVALLCVFIPVAHFVLVPSFLAHGLWEAAIGAEVGLRSVGPA